MNVYLHVHLLFKWDFFMFLNLFIHLSTCNTILISKIYEKCLIFTFVQKFDFYLLIFNVFCCNTCPKIDALKHISQGHCLLLAFAICFMFDYFSIISIFVSPFIPSKLHSFLAYFIFSHFVSFLILSLSHGHNFAFRLKCIL